MRLIGKVTNDVDISLFLDPSKGKPVFPSKNQKKPFQAVQTKKVPSNIQYKLRAEFVNSIFGNWSMSVNLYVLTLTLYVCYTAQHVLESNFTLTAFFFDKCRSGEIKCKLICFGYLTLIDLCSDESLAMFEFIESRRLATKEGIPLDDITDEMREQDGMCLYVLTLTLYVRID